MEYDDELERARARSSRRKTEKRKKSWKKVLLLHNPKAPGRAVR